VTEDLSFVWELIEGEGTLEGVANQEVEYRAPVTPGLGRLRVTVSQRQVTVTAEALITVTDYLESAMAPAAVNTRGLPGYTFERAAGELWRCRLDTERNIIVVNSGHRDFVFATVCYCAEKREDPHFCLRIQSRTRGQRVLRRNRNGGSETDVRRRLPLCSCGSGRTEARLNDHDRRCHAPVLEGPIGVECREPRRSHALAPPHSAHDGHCSSRRQKSNGREEKA
jgi:hypothetical protein